MTGFLGKAPLTSDIGLFLEIVVTAALLVARFALARKGKTMAHGFVMTSAVVLHCVSVLVIMIPSLGAALSFLFTNLSPVTIITWIHVPFGLSVLISGLFLVIGWRFRTPNDSCRRRVSLMKPLWLLWVFSLALGYLLYLSIALYS